MYKISEESAHQALQVNYPALLIFSGEVRFFFRLKTIMWLPHVKVAIYNSRIKKLASNNNSEKSVVHAFSLLFSGAQVCI